MNTEKTIYDWDSSEILICPECNERMAHKLANRKSYECQCCGNIFIPKPKRNYRLNKVYYTQP